MPEVSHKNKYIRKVVSRMSTKHIPIGIVKTCDLDGDAIVAAVMALNDNVECTNPGEYPPELKTDTDPANLALPKGWYYDKCRLRNKYRCTTGNYTEIAIKDTNDQLWNSYATEPKEQIEGQVEGSELNALALIDVLLKMNKYVEYVDPWTIKLVKPEKVDRIYVLEGWEVTGDADKKVVQLSNGFSRAYILY